MFHRIKRSIRNLLKTALEYTDRWTYKDAINRAIEDGIYSEYYLRLSIVRYERRWGSDDWSIARMRELARNAITGEVRRL